MLVWNLADPTLGFSEVPDVDRRRLDAEARQCGADLAAVVRAVVDRLGEADAGRCMAETPVVPVPA